MNRQVLYVFWEKDGIVRDYVTYYLKGLKESGCRILVIVNGKLSPEGRTKLQSVADDIFVRENKGIDFAAWQAGIKYLGWEKIRAADELILTNCSCYGPIFPFSEMFAAMDKRKCDFWGVVRHPELGNQLVNGDEKSRILEHIQSFFLVFRPQVLRSVEFRSWWDNLKIASGYTEEIAYHETKFTAYLEDAGFVGDTYIDFAKYKKLLFDNATIYAIDLLLQDRCPLLKRKALCCFYVNVLDKSLGEQGRQALDYIAEHSDYDVNLIYDDMLATQKMSDLHYNLHFNRILSSQKEEGAPTKATTALILYVYYADLLPYCRKYAESMPKDADIYVLTCDEATEQAAREQFADFGGRRVEFRRHQNRGRDVSAYLVTAADVFAKYDYVCCMHDKKSPYFRSERIGRYFADFNFDANLYNSTYVANIINRFAQEPRLGMLCPPIINFGPYYDVLGNEVTIERAGMEEVYKKLHLTVPFDDNPLFPCGTMFWVRGKAFAPIFAHKWQYKDFPPEPNPNGGTVLHALERLYPLFVQQAGYYTASVLPEAKAEVFADNLQYMLRELNLSLFASNGRGDFRSLWLKLHGCINNKIATIGTGIDKTLLKDAKHYIKNKLRYYKYKLLACLPLGSKKHEHYKRRKKEMKQRLRSVRRQLK